KGVSEVGDPLKVVVTGDALSDSRVEGSDLSVVRIGLPRWDQADAALDPGAAAVHRRALDVLEGLGATLIPVEIPLFRDVTAAVFTLFPAELATANLSLLKSSGQLYHPDVRRLLQVGALIP